MAMLESSPEQVKRINAAITEALQPMLHADGVHLTSIANIASAHV
jgi:Fe-S cluster biogenesis protein NfuA